MEILNKTRKEGENYLEYKDHSVFFTEFYELRKKYLEVFGLANIDPKTYAIEAYRLLNILISWSSSQTLFKLSLDTLRKRREPIILAMKDNKLTYALNLMEELFFEISELQQEVEILPKVEREEQDTEPIDTKIKHALTAYELIYGKNE